MNFYEGYNCPVCQQPFTENADVVACPQCGLPHHRACWSQEGHCHLQHLHNTDEQWSRHKANVASDQTAARADQQSAPYQICSVCQTQNPEFAEFCKHCGTPLKNVQNWQSATPPNPPYGEYRPIYSDVFTADNVDPNEVIDDTKAADLSAVVGTNAHYYLPRFRRMARGSNVSWNWAALFLGPFWLLYRKMYGYGIVVMLLQFIQTVVDTIAYKGLGIITTEEITDAQLYDLVQSALHDPNKRYLLLAVSLFSFVTLIISIAVALFGNRLYFDHCKKTIKKHREKTPDLTCGELASLGGTSVAIAIIGYVAQFFITQILTIFI